MSDYIRPGVYIKEVPSTVPTVRGVSTSVTVFVGTAASGPMHRAVPVRSVADYDAAFGGLDTTSEMSYAVRQFFANGGSHAHAVRVAGQDSGAVLEGLAALDEIDLFNLLCVPGVSDAAALADAAERCHARRACLLIDPPAADTTPKDVLSFASRLSLSHRASAALYYPWILTADPLRRDGARPVPPSGTIAGLFARVDRERGVWKAPAGTEATLVNVLGVARTLTTQENELLNPWAVNCIRELPRGGLVAWGARTLDGDDRARSEWKYVPVRRTALFIEQSLSHGLAWAVFEPNDEPLRARIRQSVGDFMYDLFRQGAFVGVAARDAYFVNCGVQTTTARDIEMGVVHIQVGFAPLKPAEFVVVTIRQKTARADR
jgi:uncharacterized protein